MQKSINNEKETRIKEIVMKYTNGHTVEVTPYRSKGRYTTRTDFSVAEYDRKNELIGKPEVFDIRGFIDWFNEVVSSEDINWDQEFERIQEKYR